MNFGTFDLGGSLVTSDSNAIDNGDFTQQGSQQDSTQAVNNSNASESQKNWLHSWAPLRDRLCSRLCTIR